MKMNILVAVGDAGQGRRGGWGGACQPPASSNYQCEWSVAVRATGLIRTPLKGTRPHTPVPLGAPSTLTSAPVILTPNKLLSVGTNAPAPVPCRRGSRMRQARSL